MTHKEHHDYWKNDKLTVFETTTEEGLKQMCILVRNDILQFTTKEGFDAFVTNRPK